MLVCILVVLNRKEVVLFPSTIKELKLQMIFMFACNGKFTPTETETNSNNCYNSRDKEWDSLPVPLRFALPVNVADPKGQLILLQFGLVYQADKW